MKRVVRLCLSFVLLTTGCRAAELASTPRRAGLATADAAVAAAVARRDPAQTAFEEHGESLVSRRPSHAVIVRATETRVEGPSGALVTLGASRAHRGGSSMGVAGSARRSTIGVSRALSASIEERVSSSAIGVEQTWRFDARPTGRGDLVIGVPVVHGTYVSVDARGLRFRDEGGESVYSHATFIDASGARTPIPARFADGEIRLSLRAGLLDAARYPAVLDPTISPVTLISGTGSGVYPAIGDQRAASFSTWDTTRGLVAYLDFADPSGTTLDVIRVGGTGAPSGTAVRLATDAVDAPTETACNASVCLVVYATSSALVGKRVDTAGSILDAAPIVLGSLGSLASLAVEASAAGWAVAWSDRGSPAGTSASVRARLVASDGSFVGGAPSDLGTASGSVSTSVASMGGTALVVWDDVLGATGAIMGARIDANQSVLDAPALTLVDAAGVESTPRIVARGADLLLVHHLGTYLNGSTITLSPSVVVSPQTSLVFVGSGSRPSSMALTQNATTSDLAWVIGSPVTAYRAVVPAVLGSLTSQYLGPGTRIDTIDVASMTGGVIAMTSMLRNYSGLVDTNGCDVQALRTSATAINVTVGEASVSLPSATYNPTNARFALSYLIDRANVGGAIGSVRIASTGARIDDPGVVVAIGTFNASTQSGYVQAMITWVGTDNLVTWRTKILPSGWTSPYYKVELTMFDQGSPPTVASVREPYNPMWPCGLVGGATQATCFGINGTDILWTGFASTYTSPWISIPNMSGYSYIRADGERAVAWTASSYTSLSQPSPSANRLSVGIADDGGLGIAYGTRSTLVVGRSAAGGTATSVLGSLSNLAATSLVRASFTVDAGAGLVGEPRAIFDGTYYDVFFVRGNTLYLSRVDEDGNLRDGVPSVVATGVYGYTSTPAVAGDRAGRVLVAFETYDASPSARAKRIAAYVIDWNGMASGSPNGASCSGVLDCASGNCVDGVCCNTACGFGAANDCQACSAAAGGTLADGMCGPAGPSVTCRAAAGVCDVAETCTGGTTTCPTDARVAAGTVCGALSASPCETDQMCNGASVACQPKAPAQGSPLCRASTGPCDLAEHCNGTSTSCPGDARAPTTTVCRPSVASCDAAETCDGASAACPSDGASGAGTVCRAATLPCDVEERCDGTNFACPTDEVASSGVVCRAATSTCDVAESCDGAGAACPTDAFAPATHVCRPSIGVCDLAELCTGANATCPVFDGRVPQGVSCRAAVGVCDVAEVCDGTSPVCGADGFRTKGTVCRPAAGICDGAEACSGLSARCPSDRVQVDGSACGDGLSCNGAETCVSGVCTVGEAPVCDEDAPCLEATGICTPRTRPGRSVGCSVAESAFARSPSAPPAWLACLALVPIALRLVRRRARLLGAFAVVTMVTILGGCVCGVGAVACDGACVDVGYDERNCGGCGISCGTGHCVEGACVGHPTTGAACESDALCVDGDACNGVERCVGGRCRAGIDIVCDDGLGCTTDVCNPALGSCVSTPESASCGLAP